METSSSPTLIRHAINSPSNASYSSDVSHSSTRATSPSGASYPSSSLFISSPANSSDPGPARDSLLDSCPRMGRNNNFRSVNVRQPRLMVERSPESNAAADNVSQLQRPLQPLQVTGMNNLDGPAASRGRASNSWRTQLLMEDMFSSVDSTGQPSANLIGGSPTTYPDNAQPGTGHAALMGHGNVATISDTQLDSCYAYCLDRGNGQYTRLVPADMLPPLRDVPALQRLCPGMMVLPVPRAFPPSTAHYTNNKHVLLKTPPATPTTPADCIQSQIDNIVASIPSTPTHDSHNGSTNSTSANTYRSRNNHNTTYSGTGHHQPLQRRPKVYCDKWVHEGVCAFTQQGCKYKHEMPLDKVTQHQLGLFHGLPVWWKKHQAELSRQRDAPARLSNEGRPDEARHGVYDGGTTCNGTHGADAPSRPSAASSGHAGRKSFGGTNKGISAWRQHGGHLPSGKNADLGRSLDSRAFASSNIITGTPVSARGNSVWDPSPFGPIAPPQRTAGQVAHVLGSPPRCSMASQSSQSNVPTNNPYASLNILDDDKHE